MVCEALVRRDRAISFQDTAMQFMRKPEFAFNPSPFVTEDYQPVVKQ